MPSQPYMVMIRCPTADVAVATGIRCDVGDFSHIAVTEPIVCPACDGTHRWSLGDAWLRDATFALGELANLSLAPNPRGGVISR
jgi:hypothetical protein